MIANSMGLGPGALFDLASLEPAVSGPLAAMQRETLSRLGYQTAASSGLRFPKTGISPGQRQGAGRDQGRRRGGSDHKWIDYELSGKVGGTENMVTSGIRVVRPVSRRDEEDCTRPSEPETVIAACTRLIESGQFTSRNLAIFHFDRGIAHKNKKDFERALSDYSEAIRLDPNYAHAYLNRGALLADKREIDRAIADFEAAIRLDPTEKLGYKNRAAAYKIKRDWDRAIADYGEAIRLDPSDIDIIYARGVAYLSKQDCDRAIGDFAEVIRLEPKAAGAFTLRGRCHQAKETSSGPSPIYRGDPADAARPGAVYRPRSAYRYAGDLDRAIAGYTEALGIDPKSAARLSGSRLVVSRQRRVRPRPCRLRPGASARSQERPPFSSRAASPRIWRARPPRRSPISARRTRSTRPSHTPRCGSAFWGSAAGLPSQMSKATAKVDMTAWPAPVIKLYLGELTTEALRAAADTSRPEDARRAGLRGEFLRRRDRSARRSQGRGDAPVHACGARMPRHLDRIGGRQRRTQGAGGADEPAIPRSAEDASARAARWPGPGNPARRDRPPRP